MAVCRHVTLHTGARMPSLGLGTYQASKQALEEALDCALFYGYRHIDTAYSYQNEAEIGTVLKSNLRASKVKRKDLFVTTKVPSVLLGESDLRPCVEESLEKLRLRYVDMLLIHSPFSVRNNTSGHLPTTINVSRNETEVVKKSGAVSHHDLPQAWSELEGIVRDGWTKAIGLSNFNRAQIDRILKTGTVRPANLQLECHAYLQQKTLRDYCESNGIVVTGYSPLGAPKRPKRHTRPDDPVLLQDPTVTDLATKLSKTPSQILLRFLLQLGVIPLPKSTNSERIKQNLEVYDFQIDQEDMQSLQQLDRNMKYLRFELAAGHPEYTDYKIEPF